MRLALLFTIACAAAAPIDIPIGAVLPGPLAGAVAMNPHRDAAAVPVSQDTTGGGPTSLESSGGGPSNNGLGLEQGGMRGVPEAIKNDMKQISG
ncbi:hypothetical protein A1Q2_05347 [Trichosporon asahii var. asahii CBS 8904]|jgi:hypothetical protein|uniref:Uncharacterized protein n=2 Tax=Trichosporon asahii var. asahii TaxID=189963 RepID=K1VUD8_TRIAC|nr:hypothetical protein A1Q1_06225 [Trichosporon asahii var. asahii CBS 2479]EJT45328.1 hypothetical protein A1Q1_06225 [Trichosporon asahii var. asahii CBS 2479]EKD00378.1 hypothetical protein A1Q2_05347 [Trichosporon asahii var. asahii CBS 8904]